MNTTKREEEFAKNHKRYQSVQKNFRLAFWLGLIPSGGVTIVYLLYCFIRTLAMMAGSSFIVAQYILNYANDTSESTGLVFSVNYGFLLYMLAIAVLTLVSHFMSLRRSHWALFALYAAGALYGIIGMATGVCGTAMGIFLLAYGCYGMWLEDFVRRQHKEMDALSLLEGYPDFLTVINEPKSMSNTSGLSRGRSDYQVRTREAGEDIEKPLPIMTEQSTSQEMEELSLETPLPKSKRKIDNMM